MTAQSRNVNVPVGPLVAAIGAALLLVSLFLDWYDRRTGFQVFELIDLVLVGIALALIVQLAGGMGIFKPSLSPPLALVVAVMALIIVLSQILDHPPAAVGVDKEMGIWLALAGSALMVTGGVLAMAHISLAFESRQSGGSPDHGADVGHDDPTVAKRDTERP